MNSKKFSIFFRQLANLFSSGIPINQALQLSSRNFPDKLRHIIIDIANLITQGSSLTEAFQTYNCYFPSLFICLFQTGESTGTLDRVFTHLADYYERQYKIFRQTLLKILWPLIELLLAFFIIGIVKYIAANYLYCSSEISGRGAFIKHIIIWMGTLSVIILAYYSYMHLLRKKKIIHEFILRIPVIGYASRSLAIARFTWALQLCYTAGLPIYESIQQALNATNNAAFVVKEQIISNILKDGGTLYEALKATALFPEPILMMIQTGEKSGKTEETMEQIAKQVFEDADLAMKSLAEAFSWLVWILIAIIIIYYIFSFFSIYFNRIENLVSYLSRHYFHT